MKKFIIGLKVLGITGILLAGLTGCGQSTEEEENVIEETEVTVDPDEEMVSLAGSDVFLYQNNTDSVGKEYFQGFSDALVEAGRTAVYVTPSEGTVEAQVQVIEELIDEQVASITVDSNGADGYDAVLQEAASAGIPVFSFESSVNQEYRVTHIDTPTLQNCGNTLVKIASLIGCGVDYQEDVELDAQITQAFSAYSRTHRRDKIVLRIAAIGDASRSDQNSKLATMQVELQNNIYQSVVDPAMNVVYWNSDEDDLSAKAAEFFENGEYNVVVGMTPEITAALAQYVSEHSENVAKVTGIGTPDLLADYTPNSSEDLAFTSECPYFLYDNNADSGRIAAAALLSYLDGNYDGEIGSELIVPSYDLYPERRLITTQFADTASSISNKPFVIVSKENAALWRDVPESGMEGDGADGLGNVVGDTAGSTAGR
ncbi:MAG: substrate-binding domain-containing protein [Lachnospiraceae bacterium]|nr:substrate-binding domain-containing protein [Lachnospiraceae bacterium]MDD3615662.1 substrate-binding domain-containing protein [Lachnospiraceae bacterium]